ncbi:helix-turn-helix domain-containing protein [Streptomyces actinomycinicus]|uniref:Helix-turn-helix domain-containing protein n=1 Tax=Streptomyces actinomycinicus TaxID=1695166 RepID=A0A937EQF0_9ACTN|nr:helix-turn-helix domain-containing protein [Streptomyces actinomycinicus]MBL1087667.1 helix-turn-helix domain-containing protein [Streptomyces actinomycinicus]
MHVGDLLQIEGLDLTHLWGGENLLGQAISGVTATDLEDPARFVQPGEIVLSGLVWWKEADGRARTERFVSALAQAGATALLAGEETHGSVPGDIVDACRAHGIALLAVPAHTSFRAITEAVYRRQWGDLSRRPADHFALPDNVRSDLGRLVDQGTDADTLLGRALAPFGAPPCYVLTSTGRTIARTASAPQLSAARAVESLRSLTGETLRVQAETTPYDAWYLHVPQVGGAPPRALHEIAEVIGQYRHHHHRQCAARRRTGQELISLVDLGDAGAGVLADALESCGPLAEGPWRVVVTSTGGRHADRGAAEALREALEHLTATVFAAGTTTDAEAVAVVRVRGEDTLRLDEPWSLLNGCRPETPLYAGVSSPAAEPSGLHAALTQARYALAAARHGSPTTGRVAMIEGLASLESLLAGIPTDVRTAFSGTTLGPLARSGTASHQTLLETLEVFFAHNCSWARTAKALHVHINTVHYRIERVQALTGRDLSRLDHKLDLHAALLCR